MAHPRPSAPRCFPGLEITEKNVKQRLFSYSWLCVVLLGLTLVTSLAVGRKFGFMYAGNVIGLGIFAFGATSMTMKLDPGPQLRAAAVYAFGTALALPPDWEPSNFLRLAPPLPGLWIVLLGGLVLSIWNVFEVGSRAEDFCEEDPDDTMCRDGRASNLKTTLQVGAAIWVVVFPLLMLHMLSVAVKYYMVRRCGQRRWEGGGGVGELH